MACVFGFTLMDRDMISSSLSTPAMARSLSDLQSRLSTCAARCLIGIAWLLGDAERLHFMPSLVFLLQLSHQSVTRKKQRCCITLKQIMLQHERLSLAHRFQSVMFSSLLRIVHARQRWDIRRRAVHARISEGRACMPDGKTKTLSCSKSMAIRCG